MKPGIYQLSNKEYHEGPGISNSGWGSFAKSPEYYQWRKNNPSEPSQAMLDGTQFHTAVLEPARYTNEYIAAPGGIDRRTKAGKEAWAYFESVSVGKSIVTQERMDMVTGMVASLAKSETANALLEMDPVVGDGKAEQSILFNDPDYGFLCKVRPDYLNPKYRAVIDLKSAKDVSPEGFSKAIANYGYHRQAHFYLKGVNQIIPDEYENFIFICVEPTPPYQVAVYMIDNESLNIADLELQPLRKQYAECLKTDVWPGRPDIVETITLPKWYSNRVIFNK